MLSLLTKVFNFDRQKQQQLSKWLVQDPETHNYSLETSLGDFGAVLEKVLTSSAIGICEDYKESPTTIFQITDLLNSLSKLSTWTTSGEKAKHFDSALGFTKALFLSHTPITCKWIARIILKSFNTISLKPEQLMRAIHPCLYGIYCQTASLDRAAIVLNEILSAGYNLRNMFNENGKLDLAKYRFIMQKYANPTLGERIICMESIQASSTSHVFHQLYEWGEIEFVAQQKYDGERMQIHLDSATTPVTVKIYSKTGRDSTDDRRHSHEIIKKALLSKLSADGTPMVKNCIVEAELLVINKETNKIEIFGGVQAFRGKIKLHSEPQLGTFLVFFDLLALNGENMMGFPYSLRYDKLAGIISLHGYCKLPDMKRFSIPSQKSSWSLKTFLELKLMFLNIIRNGGEGLMVKGLNGIYEAGTRDYWMKLKPDYILGNGDCHEYAIVGASWDPLLNYVDVSFNECHGMNTFFVGCITNKREMQLSNALPHILICFTIQCGFGRNDLINFSEKMLQNRITIENSSTVSSFTWKMSLSAKMIYIFNEPATFTIQGSSYEWKRNYWVVRHPRLVRECTLDRPWLEYSTTFEEMQAYGNSARAPSCLEIHELDAVISTLDCEYLNCGKLMKEARPLSKTEPITSTAHLKLREKISTSAAIGINYEYDDNEDYESFLDLDNLWIFYFNVPDSSPFYRRVIKSADSLFLIGGWNCTGDNCDVEHEDIAIFSLQCEAEQLCMQVEDIMESFPKSAICMRSKTLYILDAAFLTTKCTKLAKHFILANYSIY